MRDLIYLENPLYSMEPHNFADAHQSPFANSYLEAEHFLLGSTP